MDDALSFTVCFSREDIHGDDHSELTGLCDDVDGLSHEDDSGIERAADPYYCHTSDGSFISRNGNDELAEIRMHLVRNQEKIDMLLSKLNQCEVHIEALKAERSALVNELAAPSVKVLPPEELLSKAGDDGVGGGDSMRDTNAKLMVENSRLQLAVDIMRKSFYSYIKDRRRISAEDQQAIGDLRQENKLLRKQLSLLSTTTPEKPAILSKRECTAQTYPSDSSGLKKLRSFRGKRAHLDRSESTAATCPLDLSDITLPQLGVPLSALRSMALSDSESERTETRPTLRSIESTEDVKNDYLLDSVQPLSRDRSSFIRVLSVPADKAKNKHPAVKETSFDEGPIKTGSEHSESTVALHPGAYNLQEEFKDFGDFDEAQGAKNELEKWSSLPEKAAPKNPGGLLVDFGETPRPKCTPERWLGFKWRS